LQDRIWFLIGQHLVGSRLFVARRSNIHPQVVQERPGRSSIAITMDIYSHLTPNMQNEAAMAVDGAQRAAIKKPDDLG
jgi:integrase